MDSHDVVNRLRGIIARKETFEVHWDYPFSVDASYIKLNCEGCSITIFVDAGELDYVEQVELSEGKVIEFVVDENEPIAQLSGDECHQLIALYEDRSAILTQRWCFRARRSWKQSLNRLRRWKATRHRRRVEPPPIYRPPIRLSPPSPTEHLAVVPSGLSQQVIRVNGSLIESVAEVPYKRGDAWSLATPFIGDVPGRPGKVMAVPFVRRVAAGGWLAGVTADFTHVSIMRIDPASQELRPQLLIAAPKNCEIHCCAINGSRLYLGGTPVEKSTLPSLWSVNLEKEVRWRVFRVWLVRGWRLLRPHSSLDPFSRGLTDRHRVKFEPPSNYCPSEGKSIDDVLVDKPRDRLIAIDNVVYPKYIFEFSLSTGQSLKLVRSVEVENHESYSCIVKGVLADSYLVLLSCHSGWTNGDRRGLSFLDSESLIELASIHLPSDACQDIAITNHCMLIAGGEHGLGMLRFDDLVNLKSGQPHPLILRNEAPSSRTPLAIELATRLQFIPVDHVGTLNSVEPQEDPGHLLAIFKDSGQFVPATLSFDRKARTVRVEESLQ